MKFLVDANVAYELALHLRSLGHEIIAVVEKFPPKTPDPVIFEAAIAEEAVLITRDQDFTNTIKYPPSKTRGIIFIHWGNLRAQAEVELVVPIIQKLSPDEINGKLATIYRGGAMRVL